jgi:AcrR family transcriptional regulator
MPRIKDPPNTRGRRTRNALLAATRALLEEEGFESLTMSAVAERAGARPSVYLHFPSRAEFVAALFGYVGRGAARLSNPGLART